MNKLKQITMRNFYFLLLLASLLVTSINAQQFELSAELRPRFENKHGFGTLMQTNADGANFISQRSRLNFNFSHEKIKLGVSMQNVRVWGDVSTLAADDLATSFHEAWAEALLSDKFLVKLGRQEIVYDDHRIFGNVGWAQQARSHDAFIAKIKLSEKSKLDVGFALNADSQAGVDNLYSNVAGYKAFQYAWFNTSFNKMNLSLLALNNGVEYINSGDQKVDYSQTIGSHIIYKEGKFASDFSVYLQTGKFKNNDVSASNFSANLSYKLSNEFSVGFGGEYLSGKDSNDTSANVKSFNPLYGTNHKFNGWMDYFFVGNHIGSVGLVDINAFIGYNKDKFSAKVMPHFFSSASDIYSGSTKMDTKLGTEIDVTIGYKVASNINFSAGYSKMYATSSMERLKGGDKDENTSWSWIMFTFNPKLFSTK
ncbi:MAG: alginate export family protein [Flavobacteriaceae bacterium]|nr:alginate export family protein [Flavobacteriaceae bacterium]